MQKRDSAQGHARNQDRSQKRGQCRIIAGKWRGRKINFDDAEGLRPTTDRIRETVFSWLQAYLPQSRCLDCFAGSGALGFEALSRGASSVVFLEKNKKTVNSLKQNIINLSATTARVEQVDTLQWLSQQNTSKENIQSYDLVFLDPPFTTNLLAESCQSLNLSGCLATGTMIYLEYNIESKISFPKNWTCLKQKQSGQVAYMLMQYDVLE